MSQTVVQIDAFSSQPFGGNPAAVCLMESPANEDWMQNIAAEMNLAETAFLYPIESGYQLRWFTPEVEVELCGHATLASAFLLFEDGLVEPDQTIRFNTLSGELTAALNNGLITLDFPSKPPAKCDPPENLSRAISHTPIYTGMSKFDMIAELESEAVVRNLKPDFGLLRRIEVRGLIVTARGEGKYDCVSRFFAPRVGINEDPVTGSAHCVLAPYWAGKLGKEKLLAYQASRRGGEVRLQLNGDRVLLSGRAVITMRGELV
ncbi:MAG: PhzF family phenazine biosynthesis protein [bacterium]|nr:PhzF family phenazine biosynthesis protein [bacterium]